MPLHDWRGKESEWSGVHQTWPGEMVKFLKPRLPEPYRARLGPTPKMVRLGAGEPDTHVDRISDLAGLQREDAELLEGSGGLGGDLALMEPEVEVAVPSIEPEMTVYVSHRGRLIAAVELVSPRNKDRPDEREAMRLRYGNSLRDGVNLIVVDVHPTPAVPTVADAFNKEFDLGRPPLPAPYAVCYRVGEETFPGRNLAVWQFPLTAGETLPVVPVPLTVHRAIALDLEPTYNAAAEVAYLD